MNIYICMYTLHYNNEILYIIISTKTHIVSSWLTLNAEVHF